MTSTNKTWRLLDNNYFVFGYFATKRAAAQWAAEQAARDPGPIGLQQWDADDWYTIVWFKGAEDAKRALLECETKAHTRARRHLGLVA